MWLYGLAIVADICKVMEKIVYAPHNGASKWRPPNSNVKTKDIRK